MSEETVFVIVVAIVAVLAGVSASLLFSLAKWIETKLHDMD